MQDWKVEGENQGGEWELIGAAKNCAEQEATIDGFEKDVARMWEERDQLKEKDVVGPEAERACFEKEAARS